MKRQPARIVSIFIFFVTAGSIFAQDNWPQWRGPDQNGVSTGKNLPTNWNETENIVWKTKMPAWSGSTPIIWGDRIFVTSPSKADPNWQPPAPPQGRRGRRSRFGQARNPGGQKLFVICLSKKDGKMLWQHELDEGNRLHRKQNNSSPSPVTDGNTIWVVTGTGQVTALDMDGKQVWQRNLQKDYGDFGLNWGYASSPLLYNGLLIIEVLHGMKTDDPSYVVAFDAKSGKVIWGPERTAQGIVSASPVLADGKIYIVNEQAVTTVLAAGNEFKHLATNELDGSYTLSSPAVSGSQLFIRTSKYLYCIEKASD